MPYSIDWYIPDEILFVQFSGEVTAEELRGCLKEAAEMIEQSPRVLVHVFTDVGDVTKPVPPMESLGITREVGMPENSGWQIILREKSVILKMGIAIGTSIMKMRTRTFNTIQEAEEFLRQVDNSLNWEKANTDLRIIVN